MILVINAGSSSVKAAVFDRDLTQITALTISEIGGASILRGVGPASPVHAPTNAPVHAPTHASAIGVIFQALTDQGHLSGPTPITAIAHRVVHGGANLTAPALLTPDTIAEIRSCIPMAPLHNPANLAAIDALATLGLPQYASFDTAFHGTNPVLATTYALPLADRNRGLRRYGFHGLSYASLIGQIDPLPARLLAFHLGNGASLCAILHGQSVASSMGYSPLDGLTMGTRAGAIDPMAVLHLARTYGIDGADDILTRQSGLKGLAGTNDMATLLGRDDAQARFAIDHFCYWAARHAGSAISAMGGLDAVAFTGGIGENAPLVRDKIMAHLAWLGPKPIHIIKADEERQIARDALSLLSVP